MKAGYKIIQNHLKVKNGGLGLICFILSILGSIYLFLTLIFKLL